jgi:hypothetical protein
MAKQLSAAQKAQKKWQEQHGKRNMEGHDFIYGSVNGKPKSSSPSDSGRDFIYGSVDGKPKSSKTTKRVSYDTAGDISSSYQREEQKTMRKKASSSKPESSTNKTRKNVSYDGTGNDIRSESARAEKLYQKKYQQAKARSASTNRSSVRQRTDYDTMSKEELRMRMKYDKEFANMVRGRQKR